MDYVVNQINLIKVNHLKRLVINVGTVILSCYASLMWLADDLIYVAY